MPLIGVSNPALVRTLTPQAGQMQLVGPAVLGEGIGDVVGGVVGMGAVGGGDGEGVGDVVEEMVGVGWVGGPGEEVGAVVGGMVGVRVLGAELGATEQLNTIEMLSNLARLAVAPPPLSVVLILT